MGVIRELKGHGLCWRVAIRCKAIVPLTFLSLLLFLAACGSDSGKFRIEGSFKGFSQGELYVYSPDGGLRKLDTIAVRNGSFKYQVELDTTATFVLVFPNYSELPIFGNSGVKVELEGDASHLKEIKVKGSKENEQMTAFRLRTNELMPPEVMKAAAQFIRENPTSLVSTYLLNKFFLQAQMPDYDQAAELFGLIQKASAAERPEVTAMRKQLEGLKALKDNARLPKFTASDIKGRPVSNGDLYAQVNVITTWATWNYESMNIQRQLKRLERERGNARLKIISFCLDASVKECQKMMDRDSITWSNVCDGRMWESPALTQLGLGRVPDNIISDSSGKIIAHSLPANELKQKLESLMK